MSYWINATGFQAVVWRQREGGGESEEEMSVVGWRAQAGLIGEETLLPLSRGGSEPDEAALLV